MATPAGAPYTEANREYFRAYYQANKDRVKARVKAHREVNLESIREYDRTGRDKVKRARAKVDRHRLVHYGIGKEQWDALFEKQGRVCAICSADSPGWVRGWHTDHCHETGQVRGILCVNCNHGIGKFQDDPERLIRAAKYLADSRNEASDA